MDELTSIDPNTDYSQILPIQQKRIIAFINHFVMKTVSFLNDFSQSCESRLMAFEYKIQEVEASLLILESQLASIPHLHEDKEIPKSEEPAEPPIELTNIEVEDTHIENIPNTTPSFESDPRYSRFFKMVQVGVPIEATKLKMKAEGIDPDILE